MSKTTPHKDFIFHRHGGLIRKKRGAWVNQWRAEKALRDYGLSETYFVTGYGNEGPFGREYWLEPKSLTDHYMYFDNDDSWPLSESRRYSIEIIIPKHLENLPPLVQIKMVTADLRMSVSTWGGRVCQDGNTVRVGFETRDAMDLFIKHNNRLSAYEIPADNMISQIKGFVEDSNNEIVTAHHCSTQNSPIPTIKGDVKPTSANVVNDSDALLAAVKLFLATRQFQQRYLPKSN